MISKFGLTKSTIVFKIALVKLINNYQKKISSLYLHYFKKYLKTIRKICKKKNASEFK